MKLEYSIYGMAVTICLIGLVTSYTLPMEGNITTTKITKYASHMEKDYLFNPAILQDIENIAFENTLNKTYELHHYDCTEYSKDLVSALRAKGYKAQCTAGHTPNWDYPNHTWVSVWIDDFYRLEVEATGGYIISDEDFKENYIKVWEGRCW